MQRAVAIPVQVKMKLPYVLLFVTALAPIPILGFESRLMTMLGMELMHLDVAT
jgi:hypothetical protein